MVVEDVRIRWEAEDKKQVPGKCRDICENLTEAQTQRQHVTISGSFIIVHLFRFIASKHAYRPHRNQNPTTKMPSPSRTAGSSSSPSSLTSIYTKLTAAVEFSFFNFLTIWSELDESIRDDLMDQYGTF